MDQETINKVSVGVKVFGIVLGVVVLILALVSAFRPPVTDGPEPPQPTQTR